MKFHTEHIICPSEMELTSAFWFLLLALQYSSSFLECIDLRTEEKLQ